MTTQNNPVAGAWELHVDTISTMATSISEFVDPSHGRDRSDERYPGIALIRYGMNKSNSASSNQGSSKRIVPMIHYGMINIDLSIFSAGAFARVYPATYQDRRVALKLLYTMELTPEFIKQFYLEAQTLNDLKHPNIVECIGVTVMPPAMGVLMEFCEHGSLYNFLYKRIRESFSVKDTLADLGNRVSAFHRSSVGRGNAKESSRATGVQALERLSGAEGSSSLSPIKRKSGRRSFVRSVRSAIRDDVSLGSRVDDPMSFAVTDQHFMADAIRGLAFLHEFGYMHCDIKSLNYLVDSVSERFSWPSSSHADCYMLCLRFASFISTHIVHLYCVEITS
jgi:serine/threonine protein kinase